MDTHSLYIVDTNVPIVANNRESQQADINCVAACGQILWKIMQEGKVVVDDAYRIIGEYQHKLNPRGQPGAGDAFLKWLLINQSTRCTFVTLTPIDEPSQIFQEFPTAPALAKFDPSDRKFIAVANAHPDRPPILQAVDSKWWGWQMGLKEAGIHVKFLCPETIKALAGGKSGWK